MQGGSLFGAPRLPPPPKGAPATAPPKAVTTPAQKPPAREPAPVAR
jgi:hypothetical protein